MIFGSTGRAGVAQLVEREPSKLGVAGSSPVSRSRVFASTRGNDFCEAFFTDGFRLSGAAEAHVAQAVEHFLGKEEVTGSNPVVGSKF